MKVELGFSGQTDWEKAAKDVLTRYQADEHYGQPGAIFFSEYDLNWRADWTTVATEKNLKIQHRTASWADKANGGNSLWRVVES